MIEGRRGANGVPGKPVGETNGHCNENGAR